MSRVSNVDQLVLLLRQRLLERSRTGTKPGGAKDATPVSAVRAMAAIDAAGDGALRRAFIQDVLAEHFGRDLINDAGFQQVVDRVTTALEGDPGTAELFGRVTTALRRQARS